MKIIQTFVEKTKYRLDPFRSPTVCKTMMNIYPPYVGAGVKVDKINFETGFIRVKMGLTPFNKNVVGTQFGGSLYSMTDPFFMLLLMQKLGKEYVIWDKSAHIDFIKAGKTAVFVDIQITQQEIMTITELAKDGKAVFRDYELIVVDNQGETVAKVNKKVYIRLRDFSKSKAQTSRF